MSEAKYNIKRIEVYTEICKLTIQQMQQYFTDIDYWRESLLEQYTAGHISKEEIIKLSQIQPPQIEITVSGGLIADIIKPDNITVVVKDYDIDGTEDESKIKEDQDGGYTETIWE